MSAVYESSVGGKLKLKGADDALGVLKKKKKKSKESREKLAEAVERAKDEERSTLPPPKAVKAGKTKAELAFEEIQKKRQADRIAAQIATSHKDRVQKYNEKLEKQTDHYDIPKVGPG